MLGPGKIRGASLLDYLVTLGGVGPQARRRRTGPGDRTGPVSGSCQSMRAYAHACIMHHQPRPVHGHMSRTRYQATCELRKVHAAAFIDQRRIFVLL